MGAQFFVDAKDRLAPIRKEFPSLQFHLEMERANEPMFGKKDSFFVQEFKQILQERGIAPILDTKAGCTEGGLFSSSGMETVVFGPGVSANNIHKPNERVPIDHLEKAVRVYESTIEKFCIKGF
jgi:acetylornithine deacetylase/succinyl-diaminopimelate desuccinylase-like protein